MSSGRIFQAAREGNMSTLTDILKGGCEVDVRNPRNATPLMFACLHSRLEAVRLLLEKGASLTTVNAKGLPPLMWAACGGSLEIVQLLVTRGADIHAVDDLGMTSLQYASCHGFRDVAAFLLDQGAQIEARNGEGVTPLLAGVMGGHSDVFDLLVERGADQTVRMNDGKHLLMCAAKSGNLDLFQRIFNLHTDLLNATTPDGWTVLMTASHSCHPNIVKRILELGANPNVSIDSGRTALMVSATVNTEKIARDAVTITETFVSEADVKRRMRDLDERRLDVIQNLLRGGADKNLKDSKGKTAFDLTRMRQVKDLLRD